MGEAGHHRFPWGTSSGRLSTIDVHDDRRGCRGREPIERLARIATGRTALAMEGPAVTQGNRFPAAATCTPALAYRCFLHQRERYVLLPVQHSGWLQPFDRSLGS